MVLGPHRGSSTRTCIRMVHALRRMGMGMQRACRGRGEGVARAWRGRGEDVARELPPIFAADTRSVRAGSLCAWRAMSAGGAWCV